MSMLVEKFRSFSLVFFILTLLCGLIYAIIILDTILQAPASNDTSTSVTSDQTLINQLSGLKKSSDNSAAQTLPSGRVNPFAQ